MPDDKQRAQGDESGSADERRTVSHPGGRDFPNTNVAADQRRQAATRGEGLGAGASINRDDADPQPDDDGRVRDSRGRERDGNGDPLGGDRPTDDID
jgi:hypothetical protein